MHLTLTPPILYFGTPVILISTCNHDDTINLAPISSVFWLGWRCVIGISALSKTAENLIRSGECVINLPSEEEVALVNKLALTTGSDPVPVTKQKRGYHHIVDKFGHGGATAIPSITVCPPRVAECPIHLEAKVMNSHGLAEDHEQLKNRLYLFELKITHVHVEEHLQMEGYKNRIDPNKWRPLIMSFQRFYGLGEELMDSRLASIPEEMYASPEMPGG